MVNLKNATYKSKDTEKGVPTGAKILKKETSITVEEIENGFLITINTVIKYEDKNGNEGWCYPCKKYYSKDNPLKVEEKSLADFF